MIWTYRVFLQQHQFSEEYLPNIRSSPLSRSCPFDRIFFASANPLRLRIRPPPTKAGIWGWHMERCHYSTMLLVNTIQGAGTAIMIFLRLAGFFRLFRESVCPAFSVPGFRSDVQRTGGILFDGLLSILS